MGAILAFETVGFRHGTEAEALSNIAFELPRGGVALISGGPRAGKTTLAALAAMDLLPSRGHVRLFGTDSAVAAKREQVALRRRIAVVGESLPLLAGLTVRENCALPLAIRGVARQEGEARIAELLDWLTLGPHADTLPAALSRAERDRAAIARAVVARPDLLIADEPLSASDPQEAARVLPLLARLIDLGSAVLIAGRSLDWAAGLPGATRWRLTPGGLIG